MEKEQYENKIKELEKIILDNEKRIKIYEDFTIEMGSSLCENCYKIKDSSDYTLINESDYNCDYCDSCNRKKFEKDYEIESQIESQIECKLESENEFKIELKENKRKNIDFEEFKENKKIKI